MCGRFALTLPTDAVASWFDAAHVTAAFDQPRYNICPTQTIAAAVTYQDERHLVPMRWGFIPHWYKSPTDGPLIINARAETVAEKPAFRDAIRTRRCLIPADGFFEWNQRAGKGKEPWWIYPAEADLMAFAGVWQAWTDPEGRRQITCAMVTTQAGDRMSELHHREPVVVAPDQFGLWLGEEGKGAATLMRASDDAFYARHKVDSRVNSAKAQDADVRAPLIENDA